jgi:hypothetical protein
VSRIHTLSESGGCHQRDRRPVLLVCGIVSAVGMACARTETSPTAADAAVTVVHAVNSISDKLGELELIPGTDHAFGLEVPRGVQVSYRFQKAVHIQGDVRPEALANYLRMRVGDGEITVGASETVFDGVRAKNEPARVLRIRVVRISAQESKAILEDITPPEIQPGTNAERWKRAGFGPDGKPLDPKRVE